MFVVISTSAITQTFLQGIKYSRGRSLNILSWFFNYFFYFNWFYVDWLQCFFFIFSANESTWKRINAKIPVIIKNKNFKFVLLSLSYLIIQKLRTIGGRKFLNDVTAVVGKRIPIFFPAYFSDVLIYCTFSTFCVPFLHPWLKTLEKHTRKRKLTAVRSMERYWNVRSI